MTAPSTTFTPWRRLRDRSGRPWSLEAQVASSVLGALLLISVFSLVYLGQASYAASASDRIKEQQKEKQHLEWQRAESQRRIAELTAPGVLETRARALGYGPAKETIFIDVSTNRPSALQDQNATEVSGSVSPFPAGMTDWWAELQQRVGTWLIDVEHSTFNISRPGDDRGQLR
jgi:hypothetical protein